MYFECWLNKIDSVNPKELKCSCWKREQKKIRLFFCVRRTLRKIICWKRMQLRLFSCCARISFISRHVMLVNDFINGHMRTYVQNGTREKKNELSVYISRLSSAILLFKPYTPYTHTCKILTKLDNRKLMTF